VLIIASLFFVSALAAGPSTLTVAVFEATTATGLPASGAVSVPANYKLVGGGFYSGQPGGFVASASHPVNTTTWFASLRPIVGDTNPESFTVYAVGLYDPDNYFSTAIYQSAPVGIGASSGDATVLVPSPWVLTSGGGSTDEFLIATAPDVAIAAQNAPNNWTSSFNDGGLGGTSVTGVTSYAIGINPTGTGYSVSLSVSYGAFSASPFFPYTVAVGGGYRYDYESWYAFANSSYPNAAFATSPAWGSSGYTFSTATPAVWQTFITTLKLNN